MAQEISILLVSFFVIISIFLTVKFKQPTVFWLLIIGAIIGPFGLKLVQDIDFINSIAEFGSILLLFTIGVKFSIQKLLKQGFKPIILTSIKMFFISLIIFFFVSLFGFNSLTSLVLSIIVAITSTAIVVKIIEQKGWMDNDEVNLIISILIIEDIISVILLTFISGFKEISFYSIILQFILTILLLVAVYVFAIYVLVPFTKWVIKNSNEDVTPFIALSLAIGLSYTASKIGLSSSAGAFLAGSIIRFLPNSFDFETSISSFTLVFSSIFFLSVGMLVNLTFILNAQILMIVLILVILAVIIKFLVSATLTFFYGLNMRQSVFLGIIMIPIGEFSLLLAKESSKIGVDILPITTLLILFTSLLTPIMGRYEEGITNKINSMMTNTIRKKMLMLQEIIKSKI